MTHRLPQRIFYSLDELEALWDASTEQISRWLVHGDLNAHVRLPLMIVYETAEEIEGARIVLTKKLRHIEGYTLVLPHDCRKLLRDGQGDLREFLTDDGYGRYSLPEAADGYSVSLSDLVILDEDRLRFEATHKIGASSTGSFRVVRNRDTHEFDPTFRNVIHEGREYRFGDMQAAILLKLYEAAKKRAPWQNGKQLLSLVGSSSFKMSNVFKRNKAWRTFIVSDGRGHYRLGEDFLNSLSQRSNSN